MLFLLYKINKKRLQKDDQSETINRRKEEIRKYKNYSNTSLQRKFKSANSQRLRNTQWTNKSELSEKINEIEKLRSYLLKVYSETTLRAQTVRQTN